MASDPPDTAPRRRGAPRTLRDESTRLLEHRLRGLLTRKPWQSSGPARTIARQARVQEIIAELRRREAAEAGER
jgi:hypothetical protein